MERCAISGAELARRIGKSQNYVAKRLRHELAFTLDDLGAIAAALKATPVELLRVARGMSEVTSMPERGAWEPQQTAAAHEYDDVPDGDGFEPDVTLGDDEYA